MKGIPKDDRWYWVCGCHPSIEGPNSAAWIRANAEELQGAEFLPIPPPPGPGYACVWVKVQRDKQGKRTCDECSNFRTFSYDPDAGSVEWCEIQDEPLPDCPLGSD